MTILKPERRVPAQPCFERAGLRLGEETFFTWQGLAGPPLEESGLYEEDLTMLAERLDTIRQGADKRIPPDKRAIMHRATDELRASGIMDGVIKVGDPLPPFALKNAFGQEVRSSELLANGPLVLTVFRGSW